MSFYEAIWQGEGIGDGEDVEEALQSYLIIKPKDEDWAQACAAPGAEPCLKCFESFDAYLDNAESIESIPVTAKMIAEALNKLAETE